MGASYPVNRAHLVTKSPARPVRLGEPPLHAPNAALLIDFDNVTLGIRSDLTKELKTLLSSDIIKGKVAVQRAYADWRRYQQYIVPLTESSIDLIFAPAVGTAKKNATDIRLAVDAIELVFTRPEIGTFILLSGDSDFSTMVIKLKEYGKYVIGVGIRESASDLLIQNCDEYYSYNDLAGLTKEVDAPSAQRDPWELVQEAVLQMARNRDVMRSDRLKQVMQQINPNFDEKNAGYNRFSKFVVDAGQKGLLQVSKMENGQYEVAPLATQEDSKAVASAAPAPSQRSRARGRGRGRGGREREPAESATKPEAAPPPASTKRAEAALTLANAFHLLRRALGELRGPVGHEALRLRMVALHGRQDALLEPGRFSRLLRQAHDAEVADVRKVADNEYEIESRPGDLPPSRSVVTHRQESQAVEASHPVPAPAVPASFNPDDGQRPGIRFRRGSRAPSGLPAIPLVGVVSVTPDVAEAETPPSRRGRGRGRARPAPSPAEPSAGMMELVKEDHPKKKPARPRTRKKVE